MDITQLILDDHREQRRLFAMLDEIDPSDAKSLSAIWTRLAAFLEVHAESEERFFYPSLLHLGEGAGGRESAEDETEDAIEDHNEIRDAVQAVSTCQIGSQDWFEAVAAANKANGKHMDEEEREGLTDFRRHADLKLRHDLGVTFAAFEAEHVVGVPAVDKDPKAYITEHEAGL